MNKAELTDRLAESRGLTKKDAELALESVLDVIVEAIKAGDALLGAAKERQLVPRASCLYRVHVEHERLVRPVCERFHSAIMPTETFQ